MDYFVVVLGPAFFNYSVSYGNEQFSIPAICELGILIPYSKKYIWCTLGVPSFLADFEIIPTEAVRGQIFWGMGVGVRG
jgi:hypothetical protein